MPTVHNPTDIDLFCPALGRIIEAGETVPVTMSEAAGISTAVFIVDTDAPGYGPEPKPVPSIPVARKTAKRGSKVAEVSGEPKGETR